MSTQWINAIGLLLNMGGVVIFFFYGPPQPNFEEGVSLGVGDGTVFSDGTSVAEINTGVRRLKRCHIFFSRFALALIFVGFGFQLWATLSN